VIEMDAFDKHTHDVLKLIRMVGATQEGRQGLWDTSKWIYEQKQRWWSVKEETVESAVSSLLQDKFGFMGGKADEIGKLFAECRQQLGGEYMRDIWYFWALPAYAIECAIESARWL